MTTKQDNTEAKRRKLHAGREQLRITAMSCRDIRFHTSKDSSGSDARSSDPEYSTVYVVLDTTDPSIQGVGLAFSIGRGNEIILAAMRSLVRAVVGTTLHELRTDFRSVWRRITNDGQLVWLGPDKGPVHQAAAGVVNALWDVWAKSENKPVWQLVAEMPPEQVVSTLDFSYVTDLLTPEDALALLRSTDESRAQRAQEMAERGYPAYTTSVGWSGYSPERVRELCASAQAEGFNAFKMKVGLGEQEDRQKAAMMRELLGWDAVLMMDANSVWGVEEAIDQMQKLSQFRPYWIEEPTSPDDAVGHAAIAKQIAPIHVATGEQMSNRVMHKQFLQLGGYSILQTDVQRLAGLNEYLLVCLMAQKKGVRVCCHAGGVGLCNMAAHLAVIDFVAISCSTEGRYTEYIDHLQEHFIHPLRVNKAKYLAPNVAGWGLEMRPESLDEFEYPTGSYWAALPTEMLMENRPCAIPNSVDGELIVTGN